MTMDGTTNRGRRKAAAAAALLFIAGGLTGASVDRMWLNPSQHADMQLTAGELSDHLRLNASDEARMRALLDSIEPDIAAASELGADSLRASAARAHERLEQALPPESRQGFRDWLVEHHNKLVKRLHGSHSHR
ncbi:MAG: hypothetical protein ABIV28_08630 [Longimicrobiales bacterium]